MNLAKSFEFFNPEKVKDRIHIIGCGSVGSTVAELLIRDGLKNFSLYDFDTVEEHNLVNQMFTGDDLYKPKAHCVKNRMIHVVPDADRKELSETIKVYDKGWTGQRLSGYIFLCVDNIELRKKIVEDNMYNNSVKAMFDFRTALTSGQHYAADWSDAKQIADLLDTMDFTHAEAEKNTPLSACKVSMCVAPTVWAVAMAGVVNFMNFVKDGIIRNKVIVNPFDFNIIEL